MERFTSFVVSSAAEAELRALFLTCKGGIIIRFILPQIPVQLLFWPEIGDILPLQNVYYSYVETNYIHSVARSKIFSTYKELPVTVIGGQKSFQRYPIIEHLRSEVEKGIKVEFVVEELGHKQPPTPIHCDNVTVVGIANDSVKAQYSLSIEMRFFWVTHQVKLGKFDPMASQTGKNSRLFYISFWW